MWPPRSNSNRYPAAHFPERSFNQLVLKALFVGLPLARIEGLESRLNADLSRMAKDYAGEREAAGRSVPRDIALLTEERLVGDERVNAMEPIEPIERIAPTARKRRGPA